MERILFLLTYLNFTIKNFIVNQGMIKINTNIIYLIKMNRILINTFPLIKAIP